MGIGAIAVHLGSGQGINEVGQLLAKSIVVGGELSKPKLNVDQIILCLSSTALAGAEVVLEGLLFVTKPLLSLCIGQLVAFPLSSKSPDLIPVAQGESLPGLLLREVGQENGTVGDSQHDQKDDEDLSESAHGNLPGYKRETNSDNRIAADSIQQTKGPMQQRITAT